MSTIAPPRLLSAKEVGRILRCDPATIRALAASGRLPSVRFANRGWHRFRPEDVEKLIAGEENQP